MTNIEQAQERAYELAHEIILAATNEDELGAEALLKVFAIEVKTILNMARQPAEGTS